MDISGQRILVTGGAGFIGSHLVDALHPSNDVRVLDDFTTGRQEYLPDDITLIDESIRDKAAVAEAMSGVDLVYHQAAVVSVRRSVEAPLESHAINVDGTLSLLEQARKEDARVVLASSAAIYGHPDSIPVAEDDPKEPTSPYGLEKLTADRYASLYYDLYDLPTVTVRPFNAYGPRQIAGPYSGVIRIFIDQAQSGGPITINGDGTQTRDFVHISDLIQAYLRAGTTDALGEAFNIGTGEQTSIQSLAETILEVTGSDAEIVHEEPRPGDIQHSCADIEKATTVLNYEPRMGLTEGLETLIQ